MAEVHQGLNASHLPNLTCIKSWQVIKITLIEAELGHLHLRATNQLHTDLAGRLGFGIGFVSLYPVLYKYCHNNYHLRCLKRPYGLLIADYSDQLVVVTHVSAFYKIQQ